MFYLNVERRKQRDLVFFDIVAWRLFGLKTSHFSLRRRWTAAK